jgi:hypothetical protein
MHHAVFARRRRSELGLSLRKDDLGSEIGVLAVEIGVLDFLLFQPVLFSHVPVLPPHNAGQHSPLRSPLPPPLPPLSSASDS